MSQQDVDAKNVVKVPKILTAVNLVMCDISKKYI